MCGIGLIVSGVAIAGDSFSSWQSAKSTGASSEVFNSASEVAETAHPNIEDLCSALNRRGPDHIGGATLHLGPLKQDLETWELTHLETDVNEIFKNVHMSDSATRCEEDKRFPRRKECNVSNLINRGSKETSLPEVSSSARLDFVGATLQLRGDHSVIQPLEDCLGNLLVYNGEVFGGLVVEEHQNDSEILMESLRGCCACLCHSSHWVCGCQCTDVKIHQTIPQSLSILRGPWALIYWQAVSQTLWFGRDAIGRRSLLIHPPSAEDPRLVLTSVAPDVIEDTAGSLEYWEELACGIYSIKYSMIGDGETGDGLSHHSAPLPNGSFLEDEVYLGLRQGGLTGWARVHGWQDPWIRTLLAWERFHVTPTNTHPPFRLEPEKLSISQHQCSEDVRLLVPQEGQMTNKFPLNRDACQKGSSGTCAQDANIKKNQELRTRGEDTPVQQVLAALQLAVKRRAINIRRHWGRSQSNTSGCTSTEFSNTAKANTPVAVLFSGGLDSMILAALADQFVDSDCSIDSFQCQCDGESAPDRITAIAGVAELQEVFPSRRWRLIEIDAELSDLTEYRLHLQSLICPCNTYMDLNIGTALWLAASGNGNLWEATSPDISTVRNDLTEDDLGSEICSQESRLLQSKAPESSSQDETRTPNMARRKHHVRSEAHVLLVGSGADEQCGGWESLEAEMRLDFNRIWKRNLGRDDRCIADQGKEARFPFLDEDVVSTLLSLPLQDIVDLQQPAGIGDKKILRQVAQALGLKGAASLPKRAIQFGSRIARQSNVKDFGSNRAANQASAGSAHLKDVK